MARGDVRDALTALIGPRAAALPLPVARQLQDWWAVQCKTWRASVPAELGTGEAFWTAFARPETARGHPGIGREAPAGAPMELGD
jgi:hypothetical protein